MLRGDLLRALWRVGRNGALLGFGAAAGLVVWTGAWNLADPRDLSWDGLTLRPEAVVAAVVIAVIGILTGAVFAVIVRVQLRPFGPRVGGCLRSRRKLPSFASGRNAVLSGATYARRPGV